MINPVMNNIRLHNFSKQVTDYPIPDDTDFIKTQTLCGKLSGCGNGMDFFSCSLIRSELEINELNEYYGEITFQPAHISSNHEAIFLVQNVVSEKLI